MFDLKKMLLVSWRFPAIVFAGMLCLVTPLQAEELNIETVRNDIEAFKQSDDYRFAPQTVSSAEAYFGAGMLAIDQDQQDNASSALIRSKEKLLEAKKTAANFRQQHGDLLRLEEDAKTAIKVVKTPGQRLDPAIRGLIDQADVTLKKAVREMENGNLNQSLGHVSESMKGFRQALELMIPLLTEMAYGMIDSAASSGAKRYAPVLFQTAKEKLTALRLYIDGVESKLPERPADIIALAGKAREFAIQVKTWRRQAGSHEKLVMQDLQLRLRLAKAMGIKPDSHPLLADISIQTLTSAIEALKADLAEERATRISESRRLKEYYESEVQSKLSSQSEQLQQVRNDQLISLKDAFRAKLERARAEHETMKVEFQSQLEKETFEKKRQEKIYALFNKKEATVMVNLDGSLLIRLTSLNFASGRSKIDPKYYDTLGHLKEALDIYSDRNIRLEGHTDDRGEVKSNQLLSLKRAEAVRDFLIAAGIPGGRLKALGYGEVRPIASNEFAKGRTMNRRIDIVIGKAKQARKTSPG